MESKLQAKCVKLAKANNIIIRKIHCEGRKGWPDLVLIFPMTAVTVWVEMKNPNGKGRVSVLQNSEIRRIKGQGGHVYVCESYEHFLEILDTHVSPKTRIFRI